MANSGGLKGSVLSVFFTRFIVGLYLLIKTSTWPRLRVQVTQLTVLQALDLKWCPEVFFFPRTIPYWNNLTPSVVAAETTEEFRSLI